jgi:hypothetical protein
MKALSAAVFAAAVLAGAVALGYTTLKTSTGKQKRWVGSPVVYHLASACDPRQADRTACLSALRQGFNRWSRLGCSSLRFTEGAAGLRISSSDGENTVAWASAWPSTDGEEALAVTRPVANEYTGALYDADIVFNPKKSFSTNNAPGTTDVESVITHEAGHLLGLDHSAVADATMFYATGPNEVFRRSLTTDDIGGACAIYRNGQPIPNECAAGPDCSTYETCNGGKCSGGLGPGSRVYGQACDPNNNCAPQLRCVRVDATNGKCSQGCDPQKPTSCPNEDLCGELQGGGGACIPGTAPPPSELGAPCTTNAGCVNRFCAQHPVTEKTFCSLACDPKAPATCPQDYYCAFSPNSTGSCFAGQPPAALKRVGSACARDEECATSFCTPSLRDSKRVYCAQVCDSQNRCPLPTLCRLVTAARGLCRPGELGDACATSEECAYKMCVTDAANPSSKYCSEPCGACPEGFACGEAAPGTRACLKKAQAEGPGTKGMGDACAESGECASALCGPEKVCTHLCGECEAGFECTAAGSERVCTKRKDPPPAVTEPSGCGCGAGGEGPMTLVCLVVWSAAARRRSLPVTARRRQAAALQIQT